MSLTLIASPIGNFDDISYRALQHLKAADIVIGEEAKIARRFLAHYDLKHKIDHLYLLNEHSDASDIKELIAVCKEKHVVYFSDCGTPSFCDPGYQLVKACRKENIAVLSLPGPSSISQIISLVSEKITSFHFHGFLDRDKVKRKKEWEAIANDSNVTILMDTPYRLSQTMNEAQQHIGNRKVLLGLNLSQTDELVVEGITKNISLSKLPKKAEFMLLVYALET